jgi:predicted ester cyclase
MHVQAYRTAFPDLTITVRQLVIDGDWVAVHATGRGRHTAVFQGCPPTGRAWSAACTAMFQVSDPHVVRGWVTWDLLSILEQLGAIERSDTVSA